MVGYFGGPIQLYCGQELHSPKYGQQCYMYSSDYVWNSGLPYLRKWEGNGVSVLAFAAVISSFGASHHSKAKRGSQQGFNPNLAKEVAIAINNNSFPLPRVFPYYSAFKSLIVAYELIKTIPGNMTPGVGKITLDSIDVN